jgi:excisionase family DNA binding protein
MKNLFNVNQVAFILKVHPLTIRRYIKEGKLKAVKAGGNIRILESELDTFTREFAPTSHSIKKDPGETGRHAVVKPFTGDDPLLRLAGRGAKIELKEETSL